MKIIRYLQYELLTRMKIIRYSFSVVQYELGHASSWRAVCCLGAGGDIKSSFLLLLLFNPVYPSQAYIVAPSPPALSASSGGVTASLVTR